MITRKIFFYSMIYNVSGFVGTVTSCSLSVSPKERNQVINIAAVALDERAWLMALRARVELYALQLEKSLIETLPLVKS